MSATAVTASGKATQRTISTADLARRLWRSEAFVDELLSKSAGMGVVEHAADGWRLSAEGERRFGTAFRAFALPRDGFGT